MFHQLKNYASVCAGLMLLACGSSAESLFIGFNTQTPIQVYTTSGQYSQDIGPAGAIAVIPTSSNYFFITPNLNLTSSTVSAYNPNVVETSSFAVNDLIDNGALGSGNQLWLASYGGTVYQSSLTGSIGTTWSTGYNHIGVAFDGTYVYTTEGDTGSNIERWSTGGSLLGQISTPFVGLYGLTYDNATGDFWASSTDYVYQFDPNGKLLATLYVPGDARTPNGAVHDSVAVGNVLRVSAVPEPGSVLLLSLGAALLGVFHFRRIRLKKSMVRLISRCGLMGLAASAAFAAVNVSITPSASSVPVGDTVLWTANASDTSSATASLLYQFSVGTNATALRVVRDYSPQNKFDWTPSDQDGSYVVQAVVKSSTGSVGQVQESYVVTSRIFANAPVVSATSHPLVALYSAPPCPVGQTERVRFKTSSDTVWQASVRKSCTGNTSLNFYVAGMRASTTYQLQQDQYHGPIDTVGPMLSFKTGALPGGLPLTPYQIDVAATAPNNTAYPVLLSVPLFAKDPFATDTQGNIIWYLPGFDNNTGYMTRPVPGGTFLGIFDDDSAIHANKRLLREWDLVGNVVRETSAAAISAQLVAQGTDPITSIHHEVFRFTTGDTALLGSVERIADQGSGPVDVLGDMVIVLDSNLQLKWWWNEFDHLNIKRTAILGETCQQGNQGCPHLYAPGYSVANDWTHSNSLQPTPDGDLVLSIRNQDWVFKLNYQNGTVPPWKHGQPDNTVVWILGKGGSFTVNSTDPYPWFSGEHDVNFGSDGNLDLFDNGNTRVTQNGGNSRGQAWHLDQQSLVATPVVNLDLGHYSFATGSAERLSNGNYHFYLGFINGSYSSSVEVAPSGAKQFVETLPQSFGYRSFRMRSLYSEY